MNVATSDTGTATAGIAAARQRRRNRNTTRITSAIATSSVRSTSRSEARMVAVLSEATSRSIAAGIEARSAGRIAFTRSTVAITFAPGWRRIRISTAGRPSASPAFRRSWTESLTLATSPRRTGAPSRQATISGR